MHPACPNKKPNHLQNSFLRRTQFWVRKTFSKPASLKRTSLVALPAAIRHKASLKPNRCASATLILYNKLRLVKQQAYRVGTVALPAAIRHKASLKPNRCASATLILYNKLQKMKPKHGPKNGTAWRSHFWDRMHRLVKKQKKSTFTVSFLGPSGGTKNETAKSQN